MAKKTKKSQDLIRKSLLLGFGLADLSRTKVEKFVGNLKRNRNITKADSKKAVDEVFSEIQKAKREFEKKLAEQARKLANRLERK